MCFADPEKNKKTKQNRTHTHESNTDIRMIMG